MSGAPHTVNGNRLRLWNRLRWRLGLVPFRRCPTRHLARNIYADEIIVAGGARARCLLCEKRWPALFRGDTDEAVFAPSRVELEVAMARRKWPADG